MADNTYRHWRLVTDADSIAWLHADKAESGANTLSREVMDELDAILDKLEEDRPRGVVVLSDKPSGFIAGADIKDFTMLADRNQAQILIQFGQRVMDRLEGLRCPTVALIHGFCLGGGLELALACRYRIADDGPGTRLGLPEVKLGIHPGFGGTTRLPPLVGAPAAMDLMLTGRTITAKAAKKMGLIDHAVPTRHLYTAAREMIGKAPPARRVTGLLALTNHGLVRPLLARYLRRQVAAKAPEAHYPAPYALIDLWKRHGGNRGRMLEAERESVSSLVLGETAQNLIRVFFLQERLKTQGDKQVFTPRHVHVVGGGVMGGDIAAWCALQGLTVTVQDRKEATLAQVIKRASDLFNKRLKDRLLVRAALDRLMPDKDGLGVRRADVVIEAIFEDVAAKHALFRTLEPQLKPGAILATNTSSIPLDVIGTALADPGRLVGIHFFNPVAQMELVEIVRGPNTRATEVARACAFTRHINRLPLPVQSAPGFLVNRVLMPYLLEAVTLVSEGVDPIAVDQAALAFGMPMGPILLADTVGLDICLHVAENLGKAFNVEVPERLRTTVAEGNLGRKTGQGFYRYKGGKPQGYSARPGGTPNTALQDRMMLRLINEAVACLREGIVEDHDLLDAGIIFGTGFAPFRGGPLHFSTRAGREHLLAKARQLEQDHGTRFHPDAGWEQGTW